MTYSDTTDCGSKGKSFKKEFRSSGVQGKDQREARIQDKRDGLVILAAAETPVVCPVVDRLAANLLELHELLVLLELLLYEISNSWKFRN